MTGARRTSRTQSVVTYAVLALLTLFALFPILWGLSTSFKPTSSINAYPPEWIPSQVTLEHYERVITGSNMLLYFRNSLIILAVTAIICVVIASHAAYAADRFNFRGKQTVLFAILCTIMVPGIAVLIPLYMLMSFLGINDTLLSMILIYSASLVPTCLWIMQGFFATVPKALDDAALIDGCSRAGVFYRVVWPLTLPGLGAIALVVCRYCWNEFMIALTMSASDGTRTVPVGLYYFVSGFAVVMALLPLVVLFTIMERKFVEGLTAGAVKG
jgi:multiple sugar transport system permease protein